MPAFMVGPRSREALLGAVIALLRWYFALQTSDALQSGGLGRMDGTYGGLAGGPAPIPAGPEALRAFGL